MLIFVAHVLLACHRQSTVPQGQRQRPTRAVRTEALAGADRLRGQQRAAAAPRAPGAKAAAAGLRAQRLDDAAPHVALLLPGVHVVSPWVGVTALAVLG